MREVEQLFLAVCWEAAMLAEVPSDAGEEQACKRIDESQANRRRDALARVAALLFFRPSLARSPRVRWIFTGDSPLHAAAFMGDVPLATLLMRNGASPRRTNSDGMFTIGPQLRSLAGVMCPGVTSEIVKEACGVLLSRGYADDRGRLRRESFVMALTTLYNECRDRLLFSEALATRAPTKLKSAMATTLRRRGHSPLLAKLKNSTSLRTLCRDLLLPMEPKELAKLRMAVCLRCTCVHYAILGFQPAGLTPSFSDATIALANHSKMQAGVLEVCTPHHPAKRFAVLTRARWCTQRALIAPALQSHSLNLTAPFEWCAAQLLLWPQAFTEAVDPGVRLLAGDPAKPNARGQLPLDLAAKVGSETLLNKLLGWDHDQQELQGDVGAFGVRFSRPHLP
jgi:hypothetical protein